MKRFSAKVLSAIMVMLMALSMVSPTVFAADDESVNAVIEQLKAIDTLQQMQDERSKYSINSNYEAGYTDATLIAKHEEKRAAYETYVAEMFAARIAAQQAYDALTPDQKAQIDASLVAKLNNELDTVFHSGTYKVTPSNNEYVFEAVNDEDPNGSFSYESSAHITKDHSTPMIFPLVDTSDGKTTWTPSGKYVYGESNFDLTYCCDVTFKSR